MNTKTSYFDIATLTPLKGQAEAFCTEVKKLQRPYFPIWQADYETLINDSRSDYYLTEDGRVVIPGTADQGFALMPLKEEYADDIKSKNGIQPKPIPSTEKGNGPDHYSNPCFAEAPKPQRLWLLQGREYGDDDDTTDVFWADTDTDVRAAFLAGNFDLSESEIESNMNPENGNPLYFIIRCDDITELAAQQGG